MILLKLKRLVIIFVLCTYATCDALDYFAQRDSILNKEYKISFAGSTHLEGLEHQANEVLMKHKDEELYSGVHNPGYYPALQNVGEFLKQVETSRVFQILKAMPKAGLLHTHDIGMSSAGYIFDLTYRKNLYVCFDEDKTFQLKFFNHPDNTCNWISVAEKRNEPFFDGYLREKLSMVKKIPYRDQKEIGTVMADLARIVIGIISYKPVFEDYVYEMFLELYNDGVRYVEIRSSLQQLYDGDGNIYGIDQIVEIYQDTLLEFQGDFPDFIGFKLIYTVLGNVENDELEQHLEIYKDLKEQYGDFIAGFDMVSAEDESRPLKDFVPMLQPLRETASIQFFFHAGATNWYGCDSDENLADALLLGSKRIGHATSLVKHPKLMQMAKQGSVVIEVAPLFEHVRGLVENVRHHPAAIFGALGVNFVIGNDNPGLWGAEGLSYDWYLAFMGFASARDDLAYLKKLALNSIEYSTLDKEGKHDLLQIWTEEWNIFIHKLANGDSVP